LALLSDSGSILFQTKNWDLGTQTNVILDVIQGQQTFILNSLPFHVMSQNPGKIVAQNDMGMGYLLILSIANKILVSYAMPGAKINAALEFFEKYNEKIRDL
jgi:hypothetical protein